MLAPLNWLKDYIDLSGFTANELAERLSMGGIEVDEVSEKNGGVLDISPTPNRGDCLSLVGVARELAALTGRKVKLPKAPAPRGAGNMGKRIQVHVEDTRLIPRYTARLIEGVKVLPSPAWLRDKIESVGLRSINNIVDATNFVLMELGQPVHAFDIRFLRGGKLIIDRPDSAEKIIALDGNEYTVGTEDILNLDAEGPVGIAGIMGGMNSGVRDDTDTIVLESAYFDPISIRRTSKRLGLVTESSKRFEKGVDPEGVILALHRLTQIILKVAGGRPSADWVDIYPQNILPEDIQLSLDYVNRLLGTSITKRDAVRLLKLIGCKTKNARGKRISVSSPPWRPDLTRPVDLVEEIARLYGYKNIPEHMPYVLCHSVQVPPRLKLEEKIRTVLSTLGFYEAVSWSFLSDSDAQIFSEGEGHVELLNPLNAESRLMRRWIVPGLLKAVSYNINRGVKDISLFEMGKVFVPRESGVAGEADEHYHLAGAMSGLASPKNWEQGKRPIDIIDVKEAVFSIFGGLRIQPPLVSPSRHQFLDKDDSFLIVYDGNEIGWCGRLDNEVLKRLDIPSPVYVFEIRLDELFSMYINRKVVFKPFSRFPFVVRDVAMVVDSSVLHGTIMQSFNRHINKLVQCVELFDIYSGEGIPKGKKSMAYRLVFGSSEGTLTDKEVDEAFWGIVSKVLADVGGVLR